MGLGGNVRLWLVLTDLDAIIVPYMLIKPEFCWWETLNKVRVRFVMEFFLSWKWGVIIGWGIIAKSLEFGCRSRK